MQPKSFFKRTAVVAIITFVVAAIIYGLSAMWLDRTSSPREAFFNYLAEAFLQGRLYLVNPPTQHDLTSYMGQWYVPFPPLPALLMMPWVAVSGVEKVNTVLFSVVMGAANVTSAFLLLQSLAQRGWTHLGLFDNLCLTVLFGIGSVHWYMATIGSVWFVSQICTVTFMLLAAWLAVTTGSPLLSGSALALAILARPHVALCYPLLLAIGIQQIREKGESLEARHWVRWIVLSAIPLAVAVAALLGYNYLRFENPLDFGYLTENVGEDMMRDLQKYGQFNLHYVPHNLWAMWLASFKWNAKHWVIMPDVDGMSLLLTTPALVYLVKARKRSLLVAGAWIALGLLFIPLVTYYNTGTWQFGYRFSLDLMTPILVLLAVAAGQRVGWEMRILIIIGVVVNLCGVYWFLNDLFF